MRKVSNKCSNYLIWANFTLGRDTPRYKKRLYVDALLAIAYAIISVVLIWLQKADMIVLGLNIICLLRVLIQNTISASEVTELKRKAGIQEKHEGNSHYHIKECVICVVFSITVVFWGALFIEPSNLFTKLLATIAILIVCCNDCENIVIYAYDASI